MNYYLISSAIIAIITGIVHSVLGEKLIFIGLRKHQLSGITKTVGLGARQVGILWATWHLASVLSFSFSGILYFLASNTSAIPNVRFYQIAISIGYMLASLLVLYGTKGKHPGWIALGAVSILTYIG